MAQKLLLPYQFKKIGWVLLLGTILLTIVINLSRYDTIQLNVPVISLFNDGLFNTKQMVSISHVDISNTLFGVFFIIGSMFVGFSKEKREDEYIANLRLSSLIWAVIVNYSLLLLAFIFVYSMSFLSVMVYNMFTILIIFIIRFNYLLFKNSKSTIDEK
jgi:hypothetical protein